MTNRQHMPHHLKIKIDHNDDQSEQHMPKIAGQGQIRAILLPPPDIIKRFYLLLGYIHLKASRSGRQGTLNTNRVPTTYCLHPVNSGDPSRSSMNTNPFARFQKRHAFPLSLGSAGHQPHRCFEPILLASIVAPPAYNWP